MQWWDAEHQRWIEGEAGPYPPYGTTGSDGGGPQGGTQDGAGSPVPPPDMWPWAETQPGTGGGPGFAPPPGPGYVMPPYPGRPPDPVAPPDGPSRRRLPLTAVLLICATLAGGVGVGVWALIRNEPGDNEGGDRRASISAPANPGTATPGTPDRTNEPGTPSRTDDPGTLEQSTPGVARPAPGYSASLDPLGFTVTVPDGWERSEEAREGLPTVVTYTSPDGTSALALFEVMEPTPQSSLQEAEDNPAYGYASRRSGYEVLDRTSGDSWARLSFRYDSEQGPRQVVDHRFEAMDTTLYAIVSSGPEGTDVQSRLTTAVTSFCPADAVCG
ncbi:hypothetical protein [Streptomyces sp. NRRL B-1347]|uniref:hypothetical protein n=1 Tax=Streptomyces sp. NRRL B-1347 TaxID=1476877 RepID=UPI00131C1EDC|nr:hypothetical protein [Streptomyces sp. NRRL B-1347]